MGQKMTEDTDAHQKCETSGAPLVLHRYVSLRGSYSGISRARTLSCTKPLITQHNNLPQLTLP